MIWLKIKLYFIYTQKYERFSFLRQPFLDFLLKKIVAVIVSNIANQPNKQTCKNTFQVEMNPRYSSAKNVCIELENARLM